MPFSTFHIVSGTTMSSSGDSHNIGIGVITRRIRALGKDMPPRILVVDDDEIEREFLADRLRACGLEVSQAGDGAEALQLLERQWFPVILTDWQMPVLNGIQMVERLRARGVTDSYVVMLSVLNSSFEYEQAYEAGVDDYLTKKAHEVELLARLHAAFNTANLRRSLQEARSALGERPAGKTASARRSP